jgi:anti-anti-sigma factor
MDTADNVNHLHSSEGSFRITHVLDPPGLCVRGELDYATLPALIRALETIDGRNDASIDLAGVTFIDVASLRALIVTAARLDDGRALTLRAAPVQVRRLLEITGWHVAPRLRLAGATPSSQTTLADWLTQLLGSVGQRFPFKAHAVSSAEEGAEWRP